MIGLPLPYSKLFPYYSHMQVSLKFLEWGIQKKTWVSILKWSNFGWFGAHPILEENFHMNPHILGLPMNSPRHLAGSALDSSPSLSLRRTERPAFSSRTLRKSSWKPNYDRPKWTNEAWDHFLINIQPLFDFVWWLLTDCFKFTLAWLICCKVVYYCFFLF